MVRGLKDKYALPKYLIEKQSVPNSAQLNRKQYIWRSMRKLNMHGDKMKVVLMNVLRIPTYNKNRYVFISRILRFGLVPTD